MNTCSSTNQALGFIQRVNEIHKAVFVVIAMHLYPFLIGFDVSRGRGESAAGLELAADVNFEGWSLRTCPWENVIDSPSYLLSGRLTLEMLRGFKRFDARSQR